MDEKLTRGTLVYAPPAEEGEEAPEEEEEPDEEDATEDEAGGEQ